MRAFMRVCVYDLCRCLLVSIVQRSWSSPDVTSPLGLSTPPFSFSTRPTKNDRGPPFRSSSISADAHHGRAPFVGSSDGIHFDGAPWIEQGDLVNAVIEQLDEANVAVIRSPPGTGKTSLCLLVQRRLQSDGMSTVHWFTGFSGAGEWKQVLEKIGLPLGATATAKDTVARQGEQCLIFDDAHLTFDKEGRMFWGTLLKNFLPLVPGVRVIIAGAYTLNTAKNSAEYTPVNFGDYCCIRRICTPREDLKVFYEALVGGVGGINRGDEWKTWHFLKESLIDMSNGHVGVVRRGIGIVADHLKVGTLSTEEEALRLLRSWCFMNELTRCFTTPLSFDQGQRDAVLHAVLCSTSSGDNETPSSYDIEMLAPLARAGILDDTGGFASPAARSFYYAMIFPGRPELLPAEMLRAESSGEKLDVLVQLAISKMSSTRLQQSAYLEGVFPKEATLQEMFVNELVSLLPVRNTITSELSTSNTDISGNVNTGGLDVYVNGDLQFVVSLTRNGLKIGRKLSELTGKYDALPCKARLLVDFRSWRGVEPKLDENRLSVCFDADFKSCTSYSRLKDPINVNLAS
jgi:hypothetical protein